MQYRLLGRSGLKVSVLSFGTATFGGLGAHAKFGSTDVAAARRLLGACIEAGVNLIDTANMYSDGLAETILGEAIAGHRDELLVATKVRFPMGPGPNDQGLSRHHVIAQCDASLKRLNVDHIDLYQMHDWDGMTPLEETLDAFDSLVQSGKIRYVGISNFAGWQAMKAMEVARANNFTAPVSFQFYYSLETRDAEYELIPLALDQGLGGLVWSPLAGGLLSGKYRRDLAPIEGGRHLNDWHIPPIADQERLHQKIDVLVDIAQKRDTSAAEIALAWLLGRPAITSLIVGARTEEQLRTNLRAADLSLTADERQRLDQVSAPILLYPHWHQCMAGADRLGAPELSLIQPFLSA